MTQPRDLFLTTLGCSPLPFAVLVGDPPYALHYANPAFRALIGGGKASLVGRPLGEIVPECVGESLCALVGRVLASNRGESVGDQLFSHAGEGPRYCSFSAWPIRGPERSPARVILCVKDTSRVVIVSQESEQARLRLQEVNQALMIATVREAELAELAESRARQERLARDELRKSEEERSKEEDERVALESELAVLAERNRMARELHDTLAQAFTGIRLQLDVADDLLPTSPDEARARIARAREIAQESIVEARHAIQALRTPALRPGELAEAISRLAAEMAVDQKLEVGFECVGTPRPLESQIENEFFRTAQESLNNAYRHSSAKHVEVRLVFTPAQIELRVADNGRGFEAGACAADDIASPPSFGLQGLRERAHRIEATLDIVSRPGEGTTVRLLKRTDQ